MQLGVIKISNIDFGERGRKVYNGIEELAVSIKEKELINPITVTSLGDGKYLLAAGGRRLTACKMLNMEEVPCRIYDKPLTELELKSIELEENLRREDLTFEEECNMKCELLRVQQDLYGVKTSTNPDAEGVSLRDVANIIGISHSQLSRDVKLSETMKMFPELQWDKCKTKTDALKLQNKLEETYIRKELAKRAEASMGSQTSSSFLTKLANSYIVGDFFEGVKEFPDGIFDLVEIDPPYAIDLQAVKKEYAYDHEKYNEISKENYPDFMNRLFKECYRLMSSNSWLLCWYGQDFANTWGEKIFSWLTKAGFVVNILPCYWIKPTGQTQNPSTNLANACECFLYAKKGSPVLARQGRTNVFPYDTVTSSKKIHPTERPMELIDDIITTFAMENARVLVPFAGSGKTLMSAAKNNMIPVGFDLTSAYRNSYILAIQTLFGKGESK